jgi:hypothetical protein
MKEILAEIQHDIASTIYDRTDTEYYQFLSEQQNLVIKLLNEVYYPDLWKKNNSVINARGGGGDYRQKIQNMTRGGEISLANKDFKNFLFQFSVPGDGWPNSKPFYQVDIKFNKDGTPTLKELDVQVRCNCPFFIYNGPEYNASSGNYLFQGARGTAEPPNIRDPNRQYYICKHISAVFSLIDKKFRLPQSYFKA